MGCAKKQAIVDPKAQAEQLQQAFPSAKADAPEPTAGFVSVDAGALPDAYAGMVIGALKNNETPKAMVLITRLQRMPGLTAGQMMALNESMRTMQADLIRRADAGDPAAKDAVENLKKNLTR